MQLLKVLLYALGGLHVVSAYIRLPLNEVKITHSGSIYTRSTQKAILDPAKHTHTEELSRAILNEEGLLMTTLNITLGTPPQPFHLILSLFARDFFVISTRLEDRHYRNRKHYNASLSSTHSPNNTYLDASFMNMLATGPVSNDNMTIGTITVPSQPFIEAELLDGDGFNTDGVAYDGVLGLGCNTGDSASGNKNLVLDMWERGLVAYPVFELSIPHEFATGEEQLGELILGGSRNSEQVEMMPLANRPLEGWIFGDHIGYTVEAVAVYVADQSLLNVTLKNNSVAMIEPEWMWLFLPGQIVDYMDILMDIKDIGFNPFKFFDCNKRHTLPDLVLNLGGIEVSISPWAYSARDKDGVEGWASCISLLLDCNDDGIFLGAGFLRGVRMVVDLEKDTIGFTSRNRIPTLVSGLEVN